MSDIVQQGLVTLNHVDKGDADVQAGRLLYTVIRGVMPAGTELLRVKKAMEQAETPEDANRILLNFYQEKGGDVRRITKFLPAGFMKRAA